MPKTRVLHIYSGNLYGGIETLLLTLAQNASCCPDMNLEFALCFNARLSTEISAIQRVHLLGDVRLRFPWTWLRARARVRKVLADGRFDIVICHSSWSYAIFSSVIRTSGLPLVFSLHDATDGTFWLERLARRIVPDLVLCNSQFTTTTLLDLYPNVPVAHLYWPVAKPDLRAIPPRAQIRQGVQTSDSDVVIVQVSRLERWKGHFLHLEALSRLADLPNWTCWQVGGPQKGSENEYLESLKTEAARLGIGDRVRFLGQRTDVAALLSAADIHCQPNVGPEPFGRTFIEALAAGLPVVTTKLGAAIEIVQSSCGILVPPGDGETLAAALRVLICDGSLRRSLGTVGKIRAEQLCSPASQFPVLKDILDSVVARSRAA